MACQSRAEMLPGILLVHRVHTSTPYSVRVERVLVLVKHGADNTELEFGTV